MSVINEKIVKCNSISFVKYSAYLCGIAKMMKTAGDFPYPALLVIYLQVTCSTELILLFFFFLLAKHNPAFNSLGVREAPLSYFLSLYQVITWQQLQHQLSDLEEQFYFNVSLKLTTGGAARAALRSEAALCTRGWMFV